MIAMTLTAKKLDVKIGDLVEIEGGSTTSSPITAAAVLPEEQARIAR